MDGQSYINLPTGKNEFLYIAYVPKNTIGADSTYTIIANEPSENAYNLENHVIVEGNASITGYFSVEKTKVKLLALVISGGNYTTQCKFKVYAR